jgi:hypothetical protein
VATVSKRLLEVYFRPLKINGEVSEQETTEETEQKNTQLSSSPLLALFMLTPARIYVGKQSVRFFSLKLMVNHNGQEVSFTGEVA